MKSKKTYNKTNTQMRDEAVIRKGNVRGNNSGDIIISMRNVSKKFFTGLLRKKTIVDIFNMLWNFQGSSFYALRDINIDIREGEKVALIGLNGSGKSTLLMLISKILEPTTGSILVNTRITPILQLGVGFHLHLTARDNIFMAGSILGMTRKEIRKKMRRILSFAELTKFENMKLKDFSTGMRSRLGFSIVMNSGPQTLLLDEVLAVGDVHFRDKCLKSLGNVKNYPGTIIFVSHDMDMIKKYFDRCIYLRKGKVVADEKTSVVIKKFLREIK